MYNKPLIGNFVTLYGICIAIGILACILVLRFFGKKKGINLKFLDFVETTAYCAILGGFLAALLFQDVYNYIETGEWDWTAGITFLGGLIGGVATFLIIYNIRKKSLTGRIVDILPLAPAVITTAHAFGRIGCFFAGCCGGKVANESDFFYFLSIKFPDHMYRTYPTQLFESIFLFIITIVMLFLYYKKDFKYNFTVYLASYGIWRFLIEFVRDDDRGQVIRGLKYPTPSQIWSIVMVLGAIPVYFLVKYLFKTREVLDLDENGNLRKNG